MDKQQPTTFYVATDGSDAWSGTLPSPAADGNDGPFVSVCRARDAVRSSPLRGVEPIRVEIREGVYELDEPLALSTDDSGAPAPTGRWNVATGPSRCVTYAAYRNEQPVISAGRRITGFTETELDHATVWKADIPEVAAGDWFFTQLWVNGRRALRPRLPKEGMFTIEEPLGEVVTEGDVHAQLFTGQDRFRYREGDLDEWRNIGDVEFVGLHYWIESRINFTSVDTTTRTAHLARKSKMRLTDNFETAGAPYYVENVFEAFEEPGTWYLDRPTGTLYYRPLPGESIDDLEVFAPRFDRVLEIQGANDKEVHDVVFEGITLSHTEWVPGEEVMTSTPQAACHVGGAVFVSRSRDIVFSECSIAHVGSYGVEISGGSHHIDVEACRIVDLGGGGVKVWHSFTEGDDIVGAGSDWNYTEGCRLVRVVDSTIADGGYRFHQAVGVLIGMCTGVQIRHNEIRDFDYSGVSVGWTWGYDESHAYGNLIEYNHIHRIGRGMLSDMGGIYTLGVQPGTRITHNLIHDVQSRGYGGWGIYNDEGSSYLLVEDNVVYRTKSNGYNQHYGEENIVRNNIFAFGGEAQISRGRPEDHTSFRFTNNVIYFDSEGTVLAGNWEKTGAIVDSNLYYNVSGKPLDFAGCDLEEWRSREWLGRRMDVTSIVADPRFRDPEQGDFSFIEDSAARAVGFRPIDLSTAGPRRTR